VKIDLIETKERYKVTSKKMEAIIEFVNGKFSSVPQRSCVDNSRKDWAFVKQIAEAIEIIERDSEKQ